MKREVNPPLASKINYFALICALLGLAVSFGLVPPSAEEHLVTVLTIVGPVVIMIFRTWFTNPD